METENQILIKIGVFTYDSSFNCKYLTDAEIFEELTGKLRRIFREYYTCHKE